MTQFGDRLCRLSLLVVAGLIFLHSILLMRSRMVQLANTLRTQVLPHLQRPISRLREQHSLKN
uniref:Uncharacterized protein n=1 Tax=Arundo donax TaxID=35708 RepID=A0A0A9DEP7_ARUDO